MKLLNLFILLLNFMFSLNVINFLQISLFLDMVNHNIIGLKQKQKT